jgi:hypothetical protein
MQKRLIMAGPAHTPCKAAICAGQAHISICISSSKNTGLTRVTFSNPARALRRAAQRFERAGVRTKTKNQKPKPTPRVRTYARARDLGFHPPARWLRCEGKASE